MRELGEQFPIYELHEKPGEACGVFGVYAPGQKVAALTYDGLIALQHRGQEAAGIGVSDGSTIDVVKDVGLVTEALDNGRKLGSLPEAYLAIGHVRYGTVEPKDPLGAAQPVWYERGGFQVALGHNGNLINVDELRETYDIDRDFPSDSGLLTHIIGEEMGEEDTLPEVLAEIMPQVEGAFSLVIMGKDELIGLRDPNGFRPLMLGQLADKGWILASEKPALDIVGARVVREVTPGEMIVIGKDGLKSYFPFPPERVQSTLCSFELVYFARPDNEMLGQSVELIRERWGELLAQQEPTQADLVMGVPKSGQPAAIGYARESGIPYGHGLVKNSYIGRSFIGNSQEDREKRVKNKLNVLGPVVQGKDLVVVDDSIVRATTTKRLVRSLREAGAGKIHMRIQSMPYAWPCFYGMDTGDRRQLAAANMSVEEIRQFIGADSLVYISEENFNKALNERGIGDMVCRACMTGNYPTKVPLLQIMKR